nr:MAG TPA: hypothetical protein [Bacteriophage sp.]
MYFIYKTAFLTVYVCPRWYVSRNSYGTLFFCKKINLPRKVG